MPFADPYLAHALRLARTDLGPSADPTVPLLVSVQDVERWAPPAGCQVTARLGDICACVATEAAIAALQADGHVTGIAGSRPGLPPDCARSVPYVGAPQVHAAPRGERGDGAIVALLDTGIDVLHRAFRGGDGRTRILAIWDQGDPTGPGPVLDGRQARGTLHTRAEIDGYIAAGVVGKQLGRDLLEHGTHVASIAAGSEVRDVVTGTVLFPGGVAPEAGIVVVVTRMSAAPGARLSTGYSTSHVEALAYIEQVARAAERPVVVNVSQGMNAGAHDGTSLLEAAFDQFSMTGRRPGRIVVKSAGNERGHDSHARVSARQPERLTWEAAPHFTADVIELWFDSRDDLSFVLRAPGGEASPPVSRAAPAATFTTAAGAEARLDFTRFHADNGHSQLLITAFPTAVGGVDPGAWTLEIVPGEVPAGGLIHAWIERGAHEPRIRFTGDHRDDAHTLTIPGTANEVISVGAIDVPASPLEPFQVAPFSCLGPTRDARQLPDLCAPGQQIVAALAGTADETTRMSGTSMAAPHVSGAIALLLSAWGKRHPPPAPMLDLAQVRAALVASAQSSTGAWDPGAGHGRLDVDALLRQFEL